MNLKGEVYAADELVKKLAFWFKCNCALNAIDNLYFSELEERTYTELLPPGPQLNSSPAPAAGPSTTQGQPETPQFPMRSQYEKAKEKRAQKWKAQEELAKKKKIKLDLQVDVLQIEKRTKQINLYKLEQELGLPASELTMELNVPWFYAFHISVTQSKVTMTIYLHNRSLNYFIQVILVT